VLAIVVVLAGVVLVAAGRGGEMPAVERTDYYPLEMGPVSATDVVLLRPQMALWGYNQQMVDEALDHIADSIRERDVRIVALEQLVTDLTREPVSSMPLGSPYPGARHARPEPGHPALGYPGPQRPALGYPGPGYRGPESPEPGYPEPERPGLGYPEPGYSEPETLELGRPEAEHPEAEQRDTEDPEAEHPEAEHPEAEHQDTELDEAGPIGAPVADPPERPGQPKQDLPTWAAGTGWPPEVSHD